MGYRIAGRTGAGVVGGTTGKALPLHNRYRIAGRTGAGDVTGTADKASIAPAINKQYDIRMADKEATEQERNTTYPPRSISGSTA